MAGNEKAVCSFLVSNLNEIHLPHLGTLTSVGNPTGDGLRYITSLDEINSIRPDSSSKKADIYLNNRGISIKEPKCFLFNRLQLADIKEVFTTLNFQNVEEIISNISSAVGNFHQGIPTSYDGIEVTSRNKPWQSFFTENQFKSLLKYLMMTGSPNLGNSSYPAEFILEAPKTIREKDDISVYTFDEYFNAYKDRLFISIRRSWYGQASKSEHGRASSLMKKPGNEGWIFDTVSGKPRSGWKTEINPEERRTVYVCMIEKV